MGTLGVMLVIFSLVGCKAWDHQSKATAKEHPKIQIKKKRPTFTRGLPQELQGIYYCAEISKSSAYDDEFWELNIQKENIFLHHIGDDVDDIKGQEVSTTKINDYTYIVKGDYRYVKLVRLPDHKVKISLSTSSDVADAWADKDMLTLTTQKPAGYFGIVPDDLYGHYYVSDRGIERFYLFQESMMGGNLLQQVDSSGKVQTLESHRILRGKINGYFLSKIENNDERLLVPLSDSQLQDSQTGEIFTRYPKSEYELNKAIRQKFGLDPNPEVPGSSPQTGSPNKQPPKADEYPKTFDYADDKDDDYYDTYDDFGLNDGD